VARDHRPAEVEWVVDAGLHDVQGLVDIGGEPRSDARRRHEREVVPLAAEVDMVVFDLDRPASRGAMLPLLRVEMRKKSSSSWAGE
jgi:hypothetical protein